MKQSLLHYARVITLLSIALASTSGSAFETGTYSYPSDHQLPFLGVGRDRLYFGRCENGPSVDTQATKLRAYFHTEQKYYPAKDITSFKLKLGVYLEKQRSELQSATMTEEAKKLSPAEFYRNCNNDYVSTIVIGHIVERAYSGIFFGKLDQLPNIELDPSTESLAGLSTVANKTHEKLKSRISDTTQWAAGDDDSHKLWNAPLPEEPTAVDLQQIASLLENAPSSAESIIGYEFTPYHQSN